MVPPRLLFLVNIQSKYYLLRCRPRYLHYLSTHRYTTQHTKYTSLSTSGCPLPDGHSMAVIYYWIYDTTLQVVYCTGNWRQSWQSNGFGRRRPLTGNYSTWRLGFPGVLPVRLHMKRPRVRGSISTYRGKGGDLHLCWPVKHATEEGEHLMNWKRQVDWSFAPRLGEQPLQ